MESTANNQKQQLKENSAAFLEQCVKKILKLRGMRDIFFRVVPPAAADRPYAVILEKGAATEQVFIPQKDVARSESTGTDIFLSTDIRTGLRHLEKRTASKGRLHF